MTAQDASKAIDGVWGRLKRFKDKWVLVAFAASALVWMEGTVRAYVDLPVELEQQGHVLEGLNLQLSMLEHRLERSVCGPIYRHKAAGSGIDQT
ncbi:MAG: hypothetical protein AAF415_01490 [Pseudomonadota bacterium]